MTTANTELATIAPASTPARAQKHREPRVSKALRKAIDLLESGECKTQKAAAVRAGLNEQYFSRALQKVEIQAFIAQRRARNIAMGSLRASRRLVDLIDAESEHVAAKVSERILETTGDLKTSGGSSVSVNVNTTIAAGYVIDLTPRQPGAASSGPVTLDASMRGQDVDVTDCEGGSR